GQAGVRSAGEAPQPPNSGGSGRNEGARTGLVPGGLPPELGGWGAGSAHPALLRPRLPQRCEGRRCEQGSLPPGRRVGQSREQTSAISGGAPSRDTPPQRGGVAMPDVRVPLNHCFRVLDSATYRAIEESEFLRAEFAPVETRTTVRTDRTYT